MARALGWLAAIAAVAGMVAYGVAAHRFSMIDDRSGGSYLLATVSIFGILAMTAVAQRAWVGLALIIVAGTLFGLWFRDQTGISPTWIYLAQHAGSHGALAVFFAASLQPGREPVISRLARMVHGTLVPDRAAYTRRVTQAWSVFFATVASTSIVLFAANQMVLWSWLVNILALPLIAMMFVAEYLVRRRALRHLEHVELSAGFNAWRNLRGATAARRVDP